MCIRGCSHRYNNNNNNQNTQQKFRKHFIPYMCECYHKHMKQKQDFFRFFRYFSQQPFLVCMSFIQTFQTYHESLSNKNYQNMPFFFLTQHPKINPHIYLPYPKKHKKYVNLNVIVYNRQLLSFPHSHTKTVCATMDCRFFPIFLAPLFTHTAGMKEGRVRLFPIFSVDDL